MVWINSIHPADKARVFVESAEAQKNLEAAIIVYHISQKDKTVHWVEDRIAWDKDQHGNVVSINRLIHDTPRANRQRRRPQPPYRKKKPLRVRSNW